MIIFLFLIINHIGVGVMSNINYFIITLNYFWLSLDPYKCAEMYCDQHCFKIGSEVIESCWDCVMTINPELVVLHKNIGGKDTYRKGRHILTKDRLGNIKQKRWHPMCIWTTLCKSNLYRMIQNAEAIFIEHESRTGTLHQAYNDCMFLLEHIDKVDFHSDIWLEWYNSVAINNEHHNILRWDKALSMNRNVIKGIRTINLMFPECVTDRGNNYNTNEINYNNLVSSYRNYYKQKVTTLKRPMRYYYNKPPTFLFDFKHLILVN